MKKKDSKSFNFKTSKKDDENDPTSLDKENGEKMEEDNKVVEKLKKFGGVNYSSFLNDKRKISMYNVKKTIDGASSHPLIGSQSGGETNQNLMENNVKGHEMQDKWCCN